MRKAARARILGKRAAAAAKQARGGAWGGRGGGGRGGKGRVFRRAKRDCRVMDARRKKLSAYLFCGKDVHGWYFHAMLLPVMMMLVMRDFLSLARHDPWTSGQKCKYYFLVSAGGYSFS